MASLRIALSLAALAVTACQPPLLDREERASTETSSAAIVVDGTPEGVGMLAFLNAPDTTFTVLDELVPLDRRAAANLIAHRDGPDATHRTPDDDPFDSVAEVDDVPWVGEAALAAMVRYAESQGYVPSGGDLLGVYDGVAFTVDEATATLALVNTAEHAVLDVDVALDRRVADGIVAERPFASILQLSAVAYLGPSAMQKLREYPKTLYGTKGPSEECNAHAECQSGICAGLTLRDYGWCVETSMAGTFASDVDVAIPDGGPAVTSIIAVDGLASVPLDVVVTLDIEHPRPEDLVVFLHQPGGAGGLLWSNQSSPPATITRPSGIEGDNMVNGSWILEIEDTVGGQAGTLRGWSMWVTSNWD